ncbi:hypothetical protein AB0D78_36875 [Streptomyces avermitilis]|uniref:hypothetical protein n=1 Tax=Streptomyces avermitilis TaxID=33903 RepID=UPI0033E8F1FB
MQLRYNCRVYPYARQRAALAQAFILQGACRTVHDRDGNAAYNILAAGRADRLDASQSAGKTRTKVPAQRVAAGSHRDGQKTAAGIPGL